MANILRMEIILMNYWNHKKMRYEIENCQLLAIILRVYIYNYYKDKDRETLELCIFLVSFSVIFTSFSLFLDYRSIYTHRFLYNVPTLLWYSNWDYYDIKTYIYKGHCWSNRFLDIRLKKFCYNRLDLVYQRQQVLDSCLKNTKYHFQRLIYIIDDTILGAMYADRLSFYYTWHSCMSSPDKPTMVLEEFKYIDFLFKKVE